MNTTTRTNFRACDFNGNVQGYGTNATEAAMDMASTLGEVLRDEDSPEGIDWYVLSFEQEQDEETGEWVDLENEGDLDSSSLDF